jgi:predicted transposase YbfD/YdcC
MLLAKLGGEDTPSGIADWVAHRCELLQEWGILPGGKAPSHMTFRRVLQTILSVEEFETLVAQFHQSRWEAGQEVLLSMDGKTVRGTIERGQLRGTHLLSLYLPEHGLVLIEAAVDHKENEIVVAPHILQQVPLKGMIVVGDAMHAQRATSHQIVAAGGAWIWTVKANQPRTRWAIEKLFVHEVCNLQRGVPLSKDVQMETQVDKGHGRIEKRTLMVSGLLNEYLDWPDVAQVFRIERIVMDTFTQLRRRQVVYGLTSLTQEQASARRLLGLTRQYWGIESGLHYRRDVTLHEDRTRLTVGSAGHNMAILNNLVLGLCLRNGFRNLASARRRFNAKPHEALQLITSAKFPFL